jgi:hypothetical protein
MMERIIPPCRKCGNPRTNAVFGMLCEDCYADIPYMPSAILCASLYLGHGAARSASRSRERSATEAVPSSGGYAIVAGSPRIGRGESRRSRM